MEAAIRLLNEMVTRGLLDSYAIGGAMASLFYAEPVETRVCRQEHLLAILVQTGRDKDRARIPLLLEGTPPDRRFLDEILERHGLRGRWDQWTKGPHV
jgi:hypothetical protein